MSPQVAAVEPGQDHHPCSGVPAPARHVGTDVPREEGGRLLTKRNSIIPVEWVCDRLDLPSADTKCGLRRKDHLESSQKGGVSVLSHVSRLLEE